jgi:hypothetical protein
VSTEQHAFYLLHIPERAQLMKTLHQDSEHLELCNVHKFWKQLFVRGGFIFYAQILKRLAIVS